MDSRDTNRVNMINATVTYSDADPAATAGIPAWAPALAAIKAKMILINGFNQVGGGTSTGVTTDTNLLRQTMTGIAFKCARGTLGYANSINNNTLKALVNFNERDLNRMSKEDVDDTCQGIHDAANANAASILSFNVTGTDITDLQAAIDIYRLATQNPRQAIITRSQAKKQARQMVKEVITQLLEGQLDVMADTLKLSNRAYWDGYKQAREVIDLGSTTAKVRGSVVNKENGDPLSNVKFTIFEFGTQNVVKQVITNAEGKFGAAQIPAGDYDFQWELKGFKTQFEANVHISAGKELKRKVSLREGGGSATIEGDVTAGAIVNISLNGLPIIFNESTVRVTVTGTPLRFYAATGNMDPPGTEYLDVAAGQIIQKTVAQFASLIGFDNELEDFVNVQNNGTVTGHWELRFENLGDN